MIQFYSPDILTTLRLPESDSGHAVRVLRLGSGDHIQVIDGHGNIYECVITDPHPRHAIIEVIDTHVQPLPWRQRIAVAVAPTKHADRMEWLVEKLVEVGVNRIIPMLTARSERKVIKRERLEKIAVAAMKQSLKAVLPEIDEMTPLRDVIGLMPDAQRFVGYCDPAVERRDFAADYIPGHDTLLLIGPEGDFTPDEIKAVIESGITPVTFGANRLRTETAALYGVHACPVIAARGS
ncbi:MAG: 16S rRNA (uracil(1498)-N(3))-methyltransferase, partial [Duncaniella sp.]|nr:16S rRNA (uracil(1498)-N(3))-methyltransferase [Duncaniella sp.]